MNIKDLHIPGEQEILTYLNLQKCGIKTEDIENRKVLRKKITEAKDLSEEKLMRTTRVFSEEEQPRASKIMKGIGERRKKEKRT